jgi:hypothetical protein
MSLERAIHDLWAADHRLTALAALFTGAAAGGTPLPYAVLEHRGSQPAVRTSGGRNVERALVRFQIWAAGLADARRIAGEIDRAFDRRAFDRAGVRCLLIQRREETAAVERDGTWRLAIDYLALMDKQPEV